MNLDGRKIASAPKTAVMIILTGVSSAFGRQKKLQKKLKIRT